MLLFVGAKRENRPSGRVCGPPQHETNWLYTLLHNVSVLQHYAQHQIFEAEAGLSGKHAQL